MPPCFPRSRRELGTSAKGALDTKRTHTRVSHMTAQGEAQAPPNQEQPGQVVSNPHRRWMNQANIQASNMAKINVGLARPLRREVTQGLRRGANPGAKQLKRSCRRQLLNGCAMHSPNDVRKQVPGAL